MFVLFSLPVLNKCVYERLLFACVMLLHEGGAVYRSHQPDKLGSATDMVRVFEVTGANSGTWFTVASMIYRRAYLSVAVWRTNILAIGGEDEVKR